MNCPEARLLIGAAPASATPALEEHLAGCAECARFRTEMQVTLTNVGPVTLIIDR